MSVTLNPVAEYDNTPAETVDNGTHVEPASILYSSANPVSGANPVAGVAQPKRIVAVEESVAERAVIAEGVVYGVTIADAGDELDHPAALFALTTNV